MREKPGDLHPAPLLTRSRWFRIPDMTLFSPRCEYTVPELIPVHVCACVRMCARLSGLSQALPPPWLWFMGSVCVCCPAHFSFALSDVLNDDAENFIPDT